VHFDIACTEVDELLAGERDEARSQLLSDEVEQRIAFLMFATDVGRSTPLPRSTRKAD